MASEPLSRMKLSSVPLEESPAQGNHGFVETVNHPYCKRVANKKICLIAFIAVPVLFGLFFVPVLFHKCPGLSCDCSSPCPPFWIMYERRCYFFSKEGKNWTSSQAFCVSYNASLARIAADEKDIIMQLKGKRAYWIDLRRDRDQFWKWSNGEKPTLEFIGSGGDCAYLTDDFKASASMCKNEHYWICQRSVGVTGPVIEQKEDGA